MSLFSRNILFYLNCHDQVKEYLYNNVHYFANPLSDTMNCNGTSYPMDVYLNTSAQDLNLNLNTDESYRINGNFRGRISEIFI